MTAKIRKTFQVYGENNENGTFFAEKWVEQTKIISKRWYMPEEKILYFCRTEQKSCRKPMLYIKLSLNGKTLRKSKASRVSSRRAKGNMAKATASSASRYP